MTNYVHPGGDSKTVMFVQISPHENDMEETLCSLNFASRVRGLELGPTRRQQDAGEVFKYKQMVMARLCHLIFWFFTDYTWELWITYKTMHTLDAVNNSIILAI